MFGNAVQLQTLILTLVVFVGGGVMLMFGQNLPAGTSEAIFALWGGAAANAFNARSASQSAQNMLNSQAATLANGSGATAQTQPPKAA